MSKFYGDLRMSIYYNGELKDRKVYDSPNRKQQILEVWRKLYGPRYYKCEIIYESL